MIATVSAKGQITIPIAVRKFLGVKTGDVIDFVPRGKTIELVPTHTPVQALRGMVQKPKRPVTLADMEAAIATGGER